MVEKRAKGGAKTLSDWLRRCMATVGAVRVALFVRLLEGALSTLLCPGHAICTYTTLTYVYIHLHKIK